MHCVAAWVSLLIKCIASVSGAFPFPFYSVWHLLVLMVHFSSGGQVSMVLFSFPALLMPGPTCFDIKVLLTCKARNPVVVLLYVACFFKTL